MKRLQAVAWFNAWIVGFFGFGVIAALNGGTWNIVFFAWLGFWMLVGLLSNL